MCMLHEGTFSRELFRRALFHRELLLDTTTYIHTTYINTYEGKSADDVTSFLDPLLKLEKIKAKRFPCLLVLDRNGEPKPISG